MLLTLLVEKGLTPGRAAKADLLVVKVVAIALSWCVGRVWLCSSWQWLDCNVCLCLLRQLTFSMTCTLWHHSPHTHSKLDPGLAKRQLRHSSEGQLQREYSQQALQPGHSYTPHARLHTTSHTTASCQAVLYLAGCNTTGRGVAANIKNAPNIDRFCRDSTTQQSNSMLGEKHDW